MTLEVKPWNELSLKEINDIFSLRSEVFIVEQECAYQDVDGKDKQADHVMLHVDNELVGYTRVFPKKTYFKEASFGRAVVKKNHRGEGYGHLLVDKSLEHLKSKNQSPIKISAQSYLKEFYASHGFKLKAMSTWKMEFHTQQCIWSCETKPLPHQFIFLSTTSTSNLLSLIFLSILHHPDLT